VRREEGLREVEEGMEMQAEWRCRIAVGSTGRLGD
jgi:hypothetical protein